MFDDQGTGWVDGALIAGAVQSTVLAASLWLVSQNTVAARRISLALLVLAAMTAVHILGWTGRADPPPVAAFFPLNLPLALGPLLYAYVHALVLGCGPVREPVHWIPAALHFSYLTVVLLTPEPARSAWKENVHDDLVKPFVEGAVLVSLAAYALAVLALLRRYRAWLEQTRSDLDLFAGWWLERVLRTMLVALAALTIVRFYNWFLGELDAGPIYLWLAAWAAWLGIEAWRYSGRNFPTLQAEHDSLASPPGQTNWQLLGARWRDTTASAGWWREPDLTLAGLAQRLGTNTAYLSRALNDGLGVNFNAFVNGLRAEEVARCIDAEGGQGDLLKLALEAGFNSKATFNRAFRATLGKSPTEYQRRLRS